MNQAPKLLPSTFRYDAPLEAQEILWLYAKQTHQ